MSSQSLSPTQAHAVFDILSHHEAYAEIRDLRFPGVTSRFGPPVTKHSNDTGSSAPLLRALLNRFIVILPGLRDVSTEFWQQRIQGLMEELAKSDLSESYDKGSIGIRMTLATAIAAMVEPCARGCLGGLPKHQVNEKSCAYDTAKSDDVIAAWERFIQEIVYGDLLGKLFNKAAETDKLSDHEPLVQATHEYVTAIFGSFLHYILVVSPKGQTLIPLITRANGMVPYFLIRQTLRVGNAASMISAMVKILLAKMNITSIRNWFGGGESGDTGMNLLQQIISTVLGWDTSELKKRGTAIEKDKEAPSKEHLEVLRAYAEKTREEHNRIRSKSRTIPSSIVRVILSEGSTSGHLSEKQHKLAAEYLAIHLSIRDRKEIVHVLCHHQPDWLTSAVKDIVAAYDPIIRAVHNAVDLSAGVADFEAFLHDLVKIAKVDSGSGQAKTASVEDFVRLVKKHQGSSHRFIHQVCKNGKELTRCYQEYAGNAAAQYKQKNGPKGGNFDESTAAGDMTYVLSALISKVSEQDRLKVMKELDAHAAYIATVNASSEERMRLVIENSAQGKSELTYGPGTFLTRWQDLIDSMPITPAMPDGPVRCGASDSVKEAARIDVDGSRKGASTASKVVEDEKLAAPDVSETVRLLLPGFKEALGKLADS